MKATGTHRRFKQVLSKLGAVEKTERLIIYFNKLGQFTEMYLPTLSNTQKLSYWNIIIRVHIQCVDMEERPVKHRINLTCQICIGTVRRNIGIGSTQNIRSATGCRICGC